MEKKKFEPEVPEGTLPSQGTQVHFPAPTEQFTAACCSSVRVTQNLWALHAHALTCKCT